MTVPGDQSHNPPAVGSRQYHVEQAELGAALEILEERGSGAYGFTIKTPVNGLLHRVLPLRDPQQPRFWCVVVFRCSPGGLPDDSEQPWIGPRGLQREDLKETMGLIRADPAAWLAKEAHRQLREWMLAPGAAPDAEVTARRVPVTAPHASDIPLGSPG